MLPQALPVGDGEESDPAARRQAVDGALDVNTHLAQKAHCSTRHRADRKEVHRCVGK